MPNIKIELPKFPCEHHDNLSLWYNKPKDELWQICSICGARRPATVKERNEFINAQQQRVPDAGDSGE